MKLYTLDELKDKNGKLDYEEVRGCIETWVADLTILTKESKHSKRKKNSVLAALELFGLFGLGWDLK